MKNRKLICLLWTLLAVAALGGTCVVLLGVVWYWTYYTRIHYVATSDRHLIIGKGKRLVAIRWDELDAGRLGFMDSGDDQFQGTLNIRLDDYRIRLRLFNVFAGLDNLQGFVSTLLKQIRDNGVEG